MRPISKHLFQISLGAVNCFVIEDGNTLTLVDTGYQYSTGKIFSAIIKAGRSPQNIHNIILTHTHPDHAGSAAEIWRETGALVIAHATDASLAERGVAGRLPHVLSPGLVNWLVFRMLIKNKPNKIPKIEIHQTVGDGAVLPIAGGLRVIHSPGHSAGHIALYLEQDDVLIAGDICANVMGLGLSTVYENRSLGIKSILRVADIPFSNAVFGHGKPILGGAAAKLKAKFAKR